jgi:hypothetical protein
VSTNSIFTILLSVTPALLSCLVAAVANAQALSGVQLADAASRVDMSRRHYPLIQTSTSNTEAHFNILVPRLLNLKFIAIPEGSQNSEDAIKGILSGPELKDKKGILHEKVVKFSFAGLKPGVRYKMVIRKVSEWGTEVLDQRVFQSLDITPRPLSYAVISCMNDEINSEFEEARQKIWPKVVASRPDMIFLLGDQTYVDSFQYVTRG